MNDRLDGLIARLAAEPTDRAVDGLAFEVLWTIRQSRATRASLALAPVSFASVVLALAIGLTVGGVTATTAAPRAAFSPFAVSPDLAPSSLLDGGS